MLDTAIQRALATIGGRSERLDTCPACGRPVTTAHDRIRAWPGKLAHARCASYTRRAHRRHRG